jgi:drug/metabolite transporter (DMT)-like permease
LSALALALGASLAWGVSDFVGPLVARTLGSIRVLFWGQVGGLVAIAVAVGIRGELPHDRRILLAAPAALAGTLGLWAYYRGIAAGAISVVAPIAGASAVIPVVVGFTTGDSPSATQIAGIACALVGVVLASLEPQEGTRRVAAGVGLALLAAIGFGCYFPPMHVAGKADFWWASVIFRATALLVIATVVAVQKPSLRVRGRELAIVVAVGVGDTVGNVLFAASSGHGLVSLTAVLASLYPIVTVLLAAAVLGEQTAPAQRAGIGLTLAGVVLISI